MTDSPLLYCGRMDAHPEHDWKGRSHVFDWDSPGLARTVVVQYFCKGEPVSEGAAPCMDCGDPTRNGGPRCVPCALVSDRHEREKDEEWWS